MSGSNSFASLSPSLLARKGGARPAMRPQLQPIQQFNEATARRLEDDLGWNDHGEEGNGEETVEASQPAAPDSLPDGDGANVISLNGFDLPPADLPDVVRQQHAVASRVERFSAPRGSASARERRAAFTLRLDAERHLRLRLAATIDGRSAQQIVTEALDRLLADIPEVEALALRIGKRR